MQFAYRFESITSMSYQLNKRPRPDLWCIKGHRWNRRPPLLDECCPCSPSGSIAAEIISTAACLAASMDSSLGVDPSALLHAWAGNGFEMTQLTDRSSSASMSTAPAKRMRDSREGKPCTTLVRRLISRSARSCTLSVRILVLCDTGKAG